MNDRTTANEPDPNPQTTSIDIVLNWRIEGCDREQTIDRCPKEYRRRRAGPRQSLWRCHTVAADIHWRGKSVPPESLDIERKTACRNTGNINRIGAAILILLRYRFVRNRHQRYHQTGNYDGQCRKQRSSHW